MSDGMTDRRSTPDKNCMTIEQFQKAIGRIEDEVILRMVREFGEVDSQTIKSVAEGIGMRVRIEFQDVAINN